MPRPNRGPHIAQNERGVYEIRWTEGGRSHRVSTGAKDAVAASDAFRVWRQAIEREKAAADSSSVAGMLAAYFAEHVEEKVESAETAKIARRHLEAHFGAMHPAEIQATDVRAYTRTREAGEIGREAGASTVRRELSVLVAALNHAKQHGRLAPNEVPAIALPAAGKRRERWLTEHEVKRLFDAAAAISAETGRMCRAERWLYLAYYTGRRVSAVCELPWDRVDFATGNIDFDDPERRQTKKKRGVVYMHPKLRAAMERAWQEREGPWVLDHPGALRSHIGAFDELRRRAGLKADVTPHVLKHTAITHLLRAGVSVWDAAGAVATSGATISKVYGKHVPEAHRAAIERLR